MADPDSLPQYVPVPPQPNGHKVRPDLQTKIGATVIVSVVLGAVLWAGNKLDNLGERMTRVETKVEERFRSLELLWNAHLSGVLLKLDEANRRLEVLEKK